MTTWKPRKPPMPPRWSGHLGGVIGADPPVAVVVRKDPPPASPAPRQDEGANALEAALAKTAQGRQVLVLLEETTRLRIHEALAADLVRSSQADLARQLGLLVGRDPLAREQAAAKIPYARAEIAKWEKARADYRYRREILEHTLRDLARALPL